MTRLLIRDGWVLTMDAAVGDLPAGDVLIENGRIAAVGHSIVADDAEVIDAAGHIVMPGLVDTHRHTWQSCVSHRCGDMDSPGYFEEMLFRRGPRYRPEDVYIATLLGAVSALDSGTTTMVDWAHIVNTPDHSDAAITALVDSGVRAIFGHGWPLIDPVSWMVDSARGHPEDIRRLRKQYFSSNDGLLTLAMAGRGPEMTIPEVWQSDLRLARELAIRSTIHMGAAGRGPRYHAIAQMNQAGGLADVVAYLVAYDLSAFDAKAPPAQTAAFWRMADGGTAPEVSELADVLDRLSAETARGKPCPPPAVTLDMVMQTAVMTTGDLHDWLKDRKNRRAIPHRFDSCGYVPVRNNGREDGLWVIADKRQVVYGRKDDTPSKRLAAAGALKKAEDLKATELKKRGNTVTELRKY